MNSDLMLVMGLMAGVLAIPSLLNAWTESRAPRAGAILVMIAIGLVGSAWYLKPAGYRIGDIPGVFFGVIARLIN